MSVSNFTSCKNDAGYQAFRQAHNSLLNLLDDSPQTPYLPWVEIVFSDFYSEISSDKLEAFKVNLAQRTQVIVRLYNQSLISLWTDSSFADHLLDACSWADTQSIWHGGSKLRAYMDISLQVRILEAFIDSLTLLELETNKNRLQLASFIVEHNPSSPVALIVLGRLQLEQGQIDLAIASSKKALAFQSCCPISQQLLYNSYVAKLKIHPSTPNTEIALYDLSDYFCSKPFDTLTTSTHPKYSAYLCDCFGWLPYSVGDIRTTDSVNGLWNSEVATEIRRSILDGDFKYCSRSLCSHIVGGTLPKKSEVTDPLMRQYIDQQTTVLLEGPQSVQLSHDPTCNLACPSCRTEIITASAVEQEILSDTRDRFILPLLKQVNGTVAITGMGDPFASRHYRSILESLNIQEYPTLKVNILTNGLLFSQQQWNDIKELQKIINWLQVSVDAATAKTYEKVRFPGRWSTLMPNLELIASLRQAGEIPYFGINFVVQEANFREILDFIRLGLKLDVDLILFQKLWNFGSWDQEELLGNDVASPSHPLHAELLQILSHPLLRHPKVNAFNLTSLLTKAA